MDGAQCAIKHTMLTTSDPSKADQKDLTSNPWTRAPARRNIRALMTSKKSPSVTIVRGNVRTTRIGFNSALRIPRIAAPIMAAPALCYSDSRYKISGHEYGYGCDQPGY